jgi:hypothetical protein
MRALSAALATKTMKTLLIPGTRTRDLLKREFALQTNTHSGSLALCEHRLQSGRC